MPLVEKEATKLQNPVCYAETVFISGYWQLPLQVKSQELMSMITPDWICSFTKVPCGTTNATAHIQAQPTKATSEGLVKSKLIWVDDLLLLAKSFEDHLESICLLFRMLAALSFKVQVTKCVMYTKAVWWCSRLTSRDGIRFDSRRFYGLVRWRHQKLTRNYNGLLALCNGCKALFQKSQSWSDRF